MKRLIILLTLILIFSGCTPRNEEMDGILQIRTKLLSSRYCSFDVKITADYGNKTYGFSMQCTADEKGGVGFSVTAPETIAGITGKIVDGEGSLTFDDTALSIELLADGQLTPVCAPWIFLNTLRSGYIEACGADGEYTRVTLHDSYKADALEMDLWLDGGNNPVQAQIMWKGRKILTLDVTNFVIS